jgi:hypothetical protein
MSITFTKESDDLLVIGVDGVLTFDDLKEVEKKGHEEITADSKVKILVLAEKFSGWGKEGDWGDLTFMHEHDSYIEKIAVVAEGNWKDQILMFIGAGRRQAQVKFFFEDEEEDARDWFQSETK